MAEWGELDLSSIRTHIHLSNLWAKALLPIGRVTMAKKSTKPIPKPLCGQCYKPFDGVEAARCAREGRAFIHDCGRVLVRGKESEVPTHTHYFDSPDHTDTSTSEPTGDA